MLSHAVEAFEKCKSVDQIVLVVSAKNTDKCLKLVAGEGWKKVGSICAGGRLRQDSVANGLKELKDCKWVIVHDGARPFVTTDLIEQGLKAAKETGSAVAAVPVSDTVKAAGEDKIVIETLERDRLWAVQTPQVFKFDIIAKAYEQVSGEVTDDAALAERLGYKVKLYMGAYSNIKVTTPEDRLIAEALLKEHGK